MKYKWIEKTMVKSRAIAVKNTDSEVKFSSTERISNGNSMGIQWLLKHTYPERAPKRDAHIVIDICHTASHISNILRKQKLFCIFLIILCIENFVNKIKTIWFLLWVDFLGFNGKTAENRLK